MSDEKIDLEQFQVVSIDQVSPDPENARQRTESSSWQIGESLQQFGPLRGLVGRQLPDGSFEVQAGSGTFEKGGENGTIEEVLLVRRKKGQIVMTVADDLTEEQWKEYGIVDNTSAIASRWDYERLQAIDKQGEVNLSKWFTPEMMKDIQGWAPQDDLEAPVDFQEFGDDIETKHECPQCGYKWS